MTRNGVGAPDAEQPLDSWKEIASYLGRAVRTVQIWEKNEGLPVHRHQHSKAGTVYAYRSELETWRESRDVLTARRSHRPLWIAAALVAAAAAVGLVWSWKVQGKVGADRPGAPAFEEHSWLLIADFDNQTGEPLLDGTLEAALRREMVNSRFINVAPRERVADTLLLMDMPVDSPLDAALAREVAQRDGGIRAVVAGEVTKVGSVYLLDVEISSPAEGAIMASLSDEARQPDDLLPALKRLSMRAREALGEALPPPRDAVGRLRRVSTPSLRALQLYSQADQMLLEEHLGGPERRAAAEILLWEAVAEDPEFASAHLLIAFAKENQGRPSEEYLPHAERALELAETVSEREAYFIRASHLVLNGEREAALPIYRVLAERYPDHFWAHANLQALYSRQGRWHEAFEALTALVSLRPNSWLQTYNLAAQTHVLHGLETALPLYERAASLVPSEEHVDIRIAMAQVWLESIPAWEHWLRGDLEGVAAEVARFEQLIADTPPGARRQDLIWILFGLDGVLGRLARAERWNDMVADDGGRLHNQLVQAYLRGDDELLDERLAKYVTEFEQGSRMTPLAPELLAGLGRPEEAARLLAAGRVSGRDLAQAHIDLARGLPEEAVQGFETALPRLASRRSRYFMGMRSLAEAHRQLGDPGTARRVLEEASGRRSHMAGNSSGLFWLMHQAHLADFYREQGLTPEARAVESELLALLALADADHPLLVSLRGRMESRL